MNNLNTFESCCEYLGIQTDLPKCHVREKQIQAAYKLSVSMRAWNKQDGFEPDEKADYIHENVGYTPHFYFNDGKLLSSGHAYYGSSAGLVAANANTADANADAHIGLRLCFKTQERAVEFSETFTDIFNELI